MQISDLYKIYLSNPSITTDSRFIKKGDLFFALKGPHFNGNLFAQKALINGAAFVIVDEQIDTDNNDKIIRVDDVLTTLQLLAKYHRTQFTIPFIAITGSNGKTTTKELIHEVLSTTYTTYTTKGNLNNHIGIPLTILNIKHNAQIAVIEMGANHLKEIEQYCLYTMPTHGLITNCGKAHLEGFGGIEGILKGKGELFKYLKENDGTVFLMNDYNYLIKLADGIKQIHTYGTINANLIGKAVSSNNFLTVEINNKEENLIIETHLVGDYNLSNVLAAVAIGKYFKVETVKIKNALQNYLPTNSRSQLIEKNTNKIILDAYNANPSSMKAAIENFAKMEGENKVLLLGGMMELGDESIAEHQKIIDVINEYKWQNVVLVGGDYFKNNHSFLFLDNVQQANEWLTKQDFKNTKILIKGSRSMQMEKALN